MTSSRVIWSVAHSSCRIKSFAMSEDIVVAQPLLNEGNFLSSITMANAAATCAFAVEPPNHRVSGVAGVSGNVA